jgi:hypothetical protein
MSTYRANNDFQIRKNPLKSHFFLKNLNFIIAIFWELYQKNIRHALAAAYGFPLISKLF